MEEIIEHLMQEYKLPRYAMDAIINSPYRYMYKQMREKKFESFIHFHLGKFVVKPGWKKYAEENYEELSKKETEKVKQRYKLINEAVKEDQNGNTENS